MGREDFSVENELVEVKVQIARIDERLKSISEKQDCTHERLDVILTKMGSHAKAIERYKTDRKWIAGIFGALYALLIAWVEYRSK